MEKEVKISILIPVYNKSFFLKNLFKSLLAQTYKNINIIFLDDGSKDDSLKKIKKFANENTNTFAKIKIIALEENGGISNARNSLVTAVETEYFYFLDPDDFIYKNAMKYFINAIKKNSEAEIIIARNHFGMNRFRLPNITHNNFVFRWSKMTKKANIGHLYLENSFLTVWNKAIKTTWYRSLGIKFIKGKNYEDIYISLAMFLKMEKCHFIDKATYFYNWNFQNITLVNDDKKIEAIFHNLENLYDFAARENLLDKFIEKTNLENHSLRMLFNSCFGDALFNKIMKNIDQYKESYHILISLNQKYGIEKRIKARYLKFPYLIFLKSFKNYQRFMKKMSQKVIVKV
ncbi:glycosyltransferase family 2 protein [Candidatus Mycoplasma pogonae]